MSRPSVSVIIPVFDDPAGLKECIDALSRQTVSPSEVIVVDNGSQPPIPDILGVRIVREEEPGSYRARNAGLAVARSDIIAFTDADCRPGRDWVERGSAAVRSAFLDTGRIGAIGGMMQAVPRNPNRMTPAELFEQAAGSQRVNVEERGFAATGNMWTTRKTLDQVGLFRADLLSGGDAEWSHRVTGAGGLIVYGADVVVEHRSRRTFLSLYRQMRRIRSSPFRWHGSTERSSKRSYRQRLAQFLETSAGWPVHRRVIAFGVAVALEAARPLADIDLRMRPRDRL